MTLAEARHNNLIIFNSWRAYGQPEAYNELNNSNHELIKAYNENKRDSLYFGVQCDHPYGGEYQYEIFTARKDYKIEFKCNSKKEVIKFIEQLGQELQNK